MTGEPELADPDEEGWRERLGTVDPAEPDLYALTQFPRYRNPHDRGAEYDRIGRKQGAWMTFAHYILDIPGFMERTRQVPGRAVEYGEDEDSQFALIECPCGRKPIVRPMLEQCPGCERRYILEPKGCLVIYGDMPLPGEVGDGKSPEVA